MDYYTLYFYSKILNFNNIPQFFFSIQFNSKKLEFGVLSTPELAKLSVLEVNQRDLYDTITPGRPPVKYGALDRRMVKYL